MRLTLPRLSPTTALARTRVRALRTARPGTLRPPRARWVGTAAPRWVLYADLIGMVAILVATNLVAHFTTPLASLVTVPLSAVVLIALARHRGLGWHELGLARSSMGTGAKYAAAAIAIVAVGIAIGLLLPWTRPLFQSAKYVNLTGAVIASMIVIPLQTVIPEELAFRGALHGSLERLYGFRGVAIAGSTLFGCWHIASSLGLTSGNAGLSALLGAGALAQILGIGGAVVATSAAGFVLIWVRRRSGSLLAPIALHWALNGMGALAAAAVWQITLG